MKVRITESLDVDLIAEQWVCHGCAGGYPLRTRHRGVREHHGSHPPGWTLSVDEYGNCVIEEADKA